MKSLIKNKKTFSHKIIIALLAIIMIMPINYFYTPKVEATGFPGGGTWIVGDTSATGLKTAVESTLTTANTFATSIGMTSLTAKETIADGLMHMAAKVFLRAMVRSIIVWINSGFEGAPAFVTDLRGFLLDVADETVGEFIYNSEALNFLCSPFQLDIKAALHMQYSGSRMDNYQPQCTLTDVVNNIEGFMEGTFSDGGWPGWVELSISEDSNPTKAYLNAEAEMYARIIDAQGEEVTKLDFGDGFFSMEICDVAEKASGAKPNCVIGTPGSVIANSINDALGAGQDELIAADEINEIFNALFAQLAQQIFYGAYGLLGLGGNSAYTDYNFGEDGTGSYLDAIAEEDATMVIDTSYIEQNISRSTTIEQDYLEQQIEIASRVAAAQAAYDFVAQDCTNMTYSFPTTLQQAGETAISEIELTNSIIGILASSTDILANAPNADIQQGAITQYNELQNSGLLHTPADVTQAELFVQYDLAVELDQFETDLNQAANSCN